jgi:hypothetical protein
VNVSTEAVGVERNASVLLVFRGRAGNTDLVRRPVHPLVLDQQHLAPPAAQLQGADDAVVQQLADEHVSCGVHLVESGVEQPLLLVT